MPTTAIPMATAASMTTATKRMSMATPITNSTATPVSPMVTLEKQLFTATPRVAPNSTISPIVISEEIAGIISWVGLLCD